MWKILLAEFWGDMKAHRTRAILTMVAVAWGTLAIVLLLAFGEGLKNRLVSGLLNAGDKVVRVYGGKTSLSYQGLTKGRRIRLTEEDLEALRASVPEIDLISPHYGQWNTKLRYAQQKTTTYAIGVAPSFEEMSRMYPQAGSRFFNDFDMLEKRRVAFLGPEIKKRLMGDEDAVGKMVEIDGIPFTVIGVMQSKLQTSMSNGPDVNRAVMPATTFKTLYGPRYVDFIIVRPKSILQTDQMLKNITTILARRHKFDPDDARALGTWNFVENEKETRKVFLGIQIFLGAVGALTLVIAGVGVANIMYVTVRDRTREIGIKMAIGARRRHVLAQFVFEALLLCISGGVAGLFVAWSIISLFGLTPQSDSGAMAYLGRPTISPMIMLVCASLLTVIGLLAGYFPARRAASVDPVESLRYE
ncbi:MAG: Macrolide export ATP-binding/permease protein MacB [bacterium]|nr:Macrolide export ATP-binding/permease protein MacB [bacterium]